jgi:hypothetical protein
MSEPITVIQREDGALLVIVGYHMSMSPHEVTTLGRIISSGLKPKDKIILIQKDHSGVNYFNSKNASLEEDKQKALNIVLEAAKTITETKTTAQP